MSGSLKKYKTNTAFTLESYFNFTTLFFSESCLGSCWVINFDCRKLSRIILVQHRSSNRRCSVREVFLEILQNSQDNICARVSFLIKLQASNAFFYSIPRVTTSERNTIFIFKLYFNFTSFFFGTCLFYTCEVAK